MTENKTKPTNVSVETFLTSVSLQRQAEARQLIELMRTVSGKEAQMWGPSIIGFGTQHYKYSTGREGDMPQLGFSPRKAAITVYFNEGFDRYGETLAKLGKYKTSVSCLYINKLADIELEGLRHMLESSYALSNQPADQSDSIAEYVSLVPDVARPHFDELRQLVKELLPQAREVRSYGILGYKIDDKRAWVFVSGWKDHVAMYPVPRAEALQAELEPYIKGKGTLWFRLDEPLPTDLIKRAVRALTVA